MTVADHRHVEVVLQSEARGRTDQRGRPRSTLLNDLWRPLGIARGARYRIRRPVPFWRERSVSKIERIADRAEVPMVFRLVTACERGDLNSHGLRPLDPTVARAAHGFGFYVSFGVVWCLPVSACVALS